MFFTQENLETIDLLSSFAASIDLNPSNYTSWEQCLLELFQTANQDGQTALHALCSRNPTSSSVCMLRLLLLFGSPNHQDFRGETPLSLLLTWCFDEPIRLEMATMLLNAGADPNLCPPEFLTPLMTAVLLNDFALVDLLVSHGADVNPRFHTDSPLLVPDRATAFSLSVNKNQWHLMTYLFVRCTIHENVLFQALVKADPETKTVLRQLLKQRT
jgi:ankyrin repeat protein